MERYLPVLGVLISIYGKLPMRYRKALLLISRVRTTPDYGPLAIQLPMVSFPTFIQDAREDRPVPLDSNWIEMMHAVGWMSEGSDIANSVLSAFFRSKRFDVANEEYEREEFVASAVKEIGATQGDDRPQMLDYRSWFTEDSNIPVGPGVPARPELNADIAVVFDQFRNSFRNRLVLPRASSKTMSYDTARRMGRRSVTGKEYLYQYMMTGELPDGIMEMRQAWKYNDLTPRTYFAQGGTVFQKSFYAQDIFNTLVDSFSVSHRKQRFDLDRLDVTEEDDVWVYDYSSFTSNLTEQKHFLRSLAVFCKGYPLYVLDVHTGLERLDLGDYIMEYMEACVDCPEFEIGESVTRLIGFSGRYRHQKAGMLGAYGNLASATVLHALWSLNISGSPRKSSCVGDDGLIVRPVCSSQLEEGEMTDLYSTEEETKAAIRVLGDIADMKFRVLRPPLDTFDSRWTYLKRALVRGEDYLDLWQQDHLINLAHVFHENGLTLRTSSGSRGDDIRRVNSQVLSLLLSIHRQTAHVLSEELVLLCRMLLDVYGYLGLKKEGSLDGQTLLIGQDIDERWRGVPREEVRIREPVCRIPDVQSAEELRRNPIEVLSENHHWLGPISVPLVDLTSDYPLMVDSLVPGNTMAMGSFRMRGLLVDMDYILKEDVLEDQLATEVDFMAFRERLRDRRYSLISMYYVVRQIPQTYLDILREETNRSPRTRYHPGVAKQLQKGWLF